MQYIVEYKHNAKYLFCPICRNNFSFEIAESKGYLAELHNGIHERDGLNTPESYSETIQKYAENDVPWKELYTDIS